MRTTSSGMYGPYGFKGGMRPPLMGYAGVPAYTPGYAGPRGRQAMLMPGDWCCPNSACGYLNFAKRAECQVCSTPKNYDGPKLYDVPRSYYYPPGKGCCLHHSSPSAIDRTLPTRLEMLAVRQHQFCQAARMQAVQCSSHCQFPANSRLSTREF